MTAAKIVYKGVVGKTAQVGIVLVFGDGGNDTLDSGLVVVVVVVGVIECVVCLLGGLEVAGNLGHPVLFIF